MTKIRLKLNLKIKQMVTETGCKERSETIRGPLDAALGLRP